MRVRSSSSAGSSTSVWGVKTCIFPAGSSRRTAESEKEARRSFPCEVAWRETWLPISEATRIPELLTHWSMTVMLLPSTRESSAVAPVACASRSR